jgi:hypothetical protein
MGKVRTADLVRPHLSFFERLSMVNHPLLEQEMHQRMMPHSWICIVSAGVGTTVLATRRALRPAAACPGRTSPAKTSLRGAFAIECENPWGDGNDW